MRFERGIRRIWLWIAMQRRRNVAYPQRALEHFVSLVVLASYTAELAGYGLAAFGGELQIADTETLRG